MGFRTSRVWMWPVFVLSSPSTSILAQSLPVGERPVRAQVYLDAGYASRAMWRGTPRVSYPVTPFGAWAEVGVGGGYLSGGAWGLLQTRAPQDGDYALTESASDLAELETGLAWGRRLGQLDVEAGVSRYHLRNDAPVGTLPASFETTELHGRVSLREGRLRSLGLTPSLSAWLDVAAVKGTYLEADLTYAMPLLPVEKPIGVVHLSVRSGLSLGQSSPNGATGYFDEDGFTHLETVASFTALLTSWLGAGLTLHRVFGFDPATRRGNPASPAEDRASWGWIETWITARVPGRAW